MSREAAEGLLDCVVLGAGAAGLAAATTLREAGRTFVVLEARDRIGGRTHTIQLSSGQAAERGAETLHGGSGGDLGVCEPLRSRDALGRRPHPNRRSRVPRWRMVAGGRFGFRWGP